VITTMMSSGSAYRRCMQGAAMIRGRKRRSNRAVVAGLSLIAIALLVSSWRLASDFVTTAAAIVGFGLLMYGVHLAWLVFYDREPDGPAS
jgi:hypothetical protein